MKETASLRRKIRSEYFFASAVEPKSVRSDL